MKQISVNLFYIADKYHFDMAEGGGYTEKDWTGEIINTLDDYVAEVVTNISGLDDSKEVCNEGM